MQQKGAEPLLKKIFLNIYMFVSYIVSEIFENKAKNVFRSTCVSCTAIRDTSSALEFMKAWRHNEILTQTYPIDCLELRQ